jgi:hypothetical protein
LKWKWSDKKRCFNEVEAYRGPAAGNPADGGRGFLSNPTQVAAATAALKKASMTIIQTYMEECLTKARKNVA